MCSRTGMSIYPFLSHNQHTDMLQETLRTLRIGPHGTSVVTTLLTRTSSAYNWYCLLCVAIFLCDHEPPFLFCTG